MKVLCKTKTVSTPGPTEKEERYKKRVENLLNQVNFFSPEVVDQVLYHQITRYNVSDIRWISRISSGTFSEVHQAFIRNEPVAVKILTKQRFGMEDLMNELILQSSVKSSHIVVVNGFFFSPGFGLVMELCQGGSLFSVMNKNPSIVTHLQIFRWISHAVKALFVLHSQQPAIFHRDVKSLNLLVCSLPSPPVFPSLFMVYQFFPSPPFEKPFSCSLSPIFSEFFFFFFFFEGHL
eukprot:TRINITY_DN14082_c0_g1_i1.p1 TRINITY_DN14082_c0_g1~~TRINITY_DN14082_c0_g1_i1.p1  ORF type:complete len:235 (-),score=41.56 TRINITY_DN14082_c0_g1_i1:31-735(-)